MAIMRYNAEEKRMHACEELLRSGEWIEGNRDVWEYLCGIGGDHTGAAYRMRGPRGSRYFIRPAWAHLLREEKVTK